MSSSLSAADSELGIDCSDDSLLWIELNRPAARNALSLGLLDRLRTALEQHANAPALRAAVITGRGERSFASGGDIKELDRYRTSEEARIVAETGWRCLDAIRGFPVPVIAAINGPALGGGAELAVACDFRVAARGATLGFLQGRLNITPAWGGASDLMALAGPTHALELLLSNRVLTAADAAVRGLVDGIAREGETLREAVRAFVEPWITKPPQLIRALVGVVRQRRRTTAAALAAAESEAFLRTWTHDDHWRAVAAALQRPHERAR